MQEAAVIGWICSVVPQCWNCKSVEAKEIVDKSRSDVCWLGGSDNFGSGFV
jgi:hypothetical protein